MRLLLLITVFIVGLMSQTLETETVLKTENPSVCLGAASLPPPVEHLLPGRCQRRVFFLEEPKEP